MQASSDVKLKNQQEVNALEPTYYTHNFKELSKFCLIFKELKQT